MNITYIFAFFKGWFRAYGIYHGQLRSTALRVHRSSQLRLLFFHVEHNFARNMGKGSFIYLNLCKQYFIPCIRNTR